MIRSKLSFAKASQMMDWGVVDWSRPESVVERDILQILAGRKVILLRPPLTQSETISCSSNPCLRSNIFHPFDYRTSTSNAVTTAKSALTANYFCSSTLSNSCAQRLCIFRRGPLLQSSVCLMQHPSRQLCYGNAFDIIRTVGKALVRCDSRWIPRGNF